MRKLRIAPVYKSIRPPKRYPKEQPVIALEILDGEYKATRFAIHSVEFKKDTIQFTYDLLRVPKIFNERKFRRIISNIMYNAIIWGISSHDK